MTTPEPLPGETAKAFSAFQVYCEVGGSTTKVARKLACSRQNVDKWFCKYDWKRRFAAQRLRECEANIKAEEDARRKVSEITEERRAALTHRAFGVAEKFINHADDVLGDVDLIRKHPMAAAKLAQTVVAIDAELKGVPGAARNYIGVSVGIAMQRKFPSLAFDSDGRRVEPLGIIESYEEALKIIDAAEKQQPLPCDNWSPDHADATPTPVPEEIEQENQDVVLVHEGLPSRVDTMPTSDGRRADAPPLRR
jgi:hypothetical protein